MKIAYNDINFKEKVQKHDAIYVFDKKDKLKDLLKLQVHCINKDYIDFVDINATNYKIPCIKKCKITDEIIEPKKNEFKYAIIVPNYNNDHGYKDGEETFLHHCIRSILEQTYTNFELIVVDDMSTDTSIETIKGFNDNRIHLIKNMYKKYNGGSRNVGIDYAKKIDADYIIFLDSDDWYIDNNVLKEINDNIYGAELLLMGIQLLYPSGNTETKLHEYDNYEDFYFSLNKVWCTAWARVIRMDKIVYFPEDTLMEDRVWSYEQADNVNIDKVVNIQKPLYVWNRCNVTNSVSIKRGKIWEASAYKHIGQQLMFMERMKHTEFKPKLKKRIQECMKKVENGTYEQY